MTPFIQSALPWVVDAGVPAIDALRDCRRVIGQAACRDDVDATLRDEGPHVACLLTVRGRGSDVNVTVRAHRDLVIHENKGPIQIADFIVATLDRCLGADLAETPPPPHPDEVTLAALVIADAMRREGCGPMPHEDMHATIRCANPLGTGGLHVEDVGMAGRWHGTDEGDPWCVPGPVRLSSSIMTQDDGRIVHVFDIGGDVGPRRSIWITPPDAVERLRLEARVAAMKGDAA